MITLRDILKLNETVTLLDLDVRDTDRRLIKKVIIGKNYNVSIHQKSDENRGKFEYIDANINIHGKTDRRGISEMAYGMNWKEIPKKYLDMEIDLLHSVSSRYGPNNGMMLWADIIPIQVQMEV